MGCAQVQAGNEVLNPNFFIGNIQGIILRWWEAGRLTAAGNFQDGGPFGIGGIGNGVNANVTIVPGVVNNRPVARYNGVNSATTTNTFSANNNFSCFIVSKLAAAGGVYVGFCNAVATNQLLVSNAGENLACFDNATQPTSNPIDNHTAFTVVGVICTAGTCVFYQNGVVVPTAGGGNIGNLTNLINFGAVIGVFSAFDIAELTLYSAALTANELARLTEYFRAKYNLF